MSTTPPEKHVNAGGYLKPRSSRIILTLVGLFVVLAAIIPPVVVTTLRKQQNSMGPKAKVFVPLYVYPAPGAWAPLEDVVAAHPEVNFTVVINPGDGPGSNALPDANYTRAIPHLVSYSNVRLLGYVYTKYATRDASSVRRDIQTYAAWPTNSSNPDMAVQGIFFDETPQQYSASSLAYLQGLTDFVKSLDGLGGQFVVQNPGAIPDWRYLPTADSTVAFEETYSVFEERKEANLFASIPNSNRTQLCALIHSVPEDIEGQQLRGLVKDVREVADEIFITHLNTDYYASFGSKWVDFVDLMAE